MRPRALPAQLVALLQVAALPVLLAGCGLEAVFANIGHEQLDRPSSKIKGTLPAGILDPTTLPPDGGAENPYPLTVLDGDGNEVVPFKRVIDFKNPDAPRYELWLPSSKYQMLRVRLRQFGNGPSGQLEYRTIVPSVGEESEVTGVDFTPESITETLIVEARLSADGSTLKQVTPSAYSPSATAGTRYLILKALAPGATGPTAELRDYIKRLIDAIDPELSTLPVDSPAIFNQPAYTTDGKTYKVKTSAIYSSWLAQRPVDFVGDGFKRKFSDDFDAKLAEAAGLYLPGGCADPDKIRVVFTVDFNSGSKNGNCGTIDRFVWAKDKPGKSMFFVGWTYVLDPPGASGISEPDVDKAMGNSTPNSIPMYDDGTNGDKTAGDNVWSIYFDLPRPRGGKPLRIGYKYTWGTSGAAWSGSEEWPGNSRMLEIVDDNNDNFVYRHDAFGDESTNKDKANLTIYGSGTLGWTTDLHKCGTPESHENKYDNATCKCGEVLTPKWIGPLTVTCQ